MPGQSADFLAARHLPQRHRQIFATIAITPRHGGSQHPAVRGKSHHATMLPVTCILRPLWLHIPAMLVSVQLTDLLASGHFPQTDFIVSVDGRGYHSTVWREGQRWN